MQTSDSEAQIRGRSRRSGACLAEGVPSSVTMILRSPTAQSLSFACIMDLPAIAPGDVLRLARGCPRLTTLDYSLDPVDSDDELPPLDKNLSVADQSHIGDLYALLDSRCREANIPPRFQIKLLV